MFKVNGWVMEFGPWGTAYWLCFAFAFGYGLVAWGRFFPDNLFLRAVAAFVVQKAIGFFMVGAGIALGVPLIISIAFPQVGFVAFAYFLGGLCIAMPGIGLIWTAYRVPETALGMAVSTVLVLSALAGLMALSTWMYQRETQPALDAVRDFERKEVERRALEKYILKNHQDAVAKAFPLQANEEPYASALKCVQPVLDEIAARYRADKRWPAISAKVDAIAANPQCQVASSGTDKDGEVRLGVVDPDPPGKLRNAFRPADVSPEEWRKTLKKRAERKPDPKSMTLNLYPHVRDDGTVQWLCAAEEEFYLYLKMQGCRGYGRGKEYRP
jgi:hypothetical protein